LASSVQGLAWRLRILVYLFEAQKHLEHA